MIPTEYQLTPISFTTVHSFDPFWTLRIENQQRGLACGGAFIASVPVVQLFYASFQRRIMLGITMTVMADQ